MYESDSTLIVFSVSSDTSNNTPDVFVLVTLSIHFKHYCVMCKIIVVLCHTMRMFIGNMS